VVHSPLNVLAEDQIEQPDRRETAEQDLFRSALITGGSRGLGLEIAESLGDHGARLIISSRKAGDLESAREAIRQEPVELEASMR